MEKKTKVSTEESGSGGWPLGHSPVMEIQQVHAQKATLKLEGMERAVATTLAGYMKTQIPMLAVDSITVDPKTRSCMPSVVMKDTLKWIPVQALVDPNTFASLPCPNCRLKGTTVCKKCGAQMRLQVRCPRGQKFYQVSTADLQVLDDRIQVQGAQHFAIPGERPTGLSPDPKTGGSADLKDGPLGPFGGTGASAPGAVPIVLLGEDQCLDIEMIVRKGIAYDEAHFAVADNNIGLSTISKVEIDKKWWKNKLNTSQKETIKKSCPNGVLQTIQDIEQFDPRQPNCTKCQICQHTAIQIDSKSSGKILIKDEAPWFLHVETPAHVSMNYVLSTAFKLFQDRLKQVMEDVLLPVDISKYTPNEIAMLEFRFIPDNEQKGAGRFYLPKREIWLAHLLAVQLAQPNPELQQELVTLIVNLFSSFPFLKISQTDENRLKFFRDWQRTRKPQQSVHEHILATQEEMKLTNYFPTTSDSKEQEFQKHLTNLLCKFKLFPTELFATFRDPNPQERPLSIQLVVHDHLKHMPQIAIRNAARQLLDQLKIALPRNFC